MALQASLSRQFAKWAATLTFDDLPDAVVEKLKSLLLLHLVGGALGCRERQAEQIVELVAREEPSCDGATVLGHAARATRAGAVLANAEILHAVGLYDSFRMITHPGPVLIAVGLVNAELEQKTPRDLLTALAAGYEFECRLADDFVPTVAAHGFRPSPVFSTMGACVVAGKLLGLDEERLVSTIAVAASCASGLNEPGRTGGQELMLHELSAARQGLFAAVMAKAVRLRGSETALEGEAGFFHAFTGSNDGTLTHVFEGPKSADLLSIAADLGNTYKLLQVMYRVYAIGGFNQPVIELVLKMLAEHDLQHTDIRELTIEMNYLETLYPSPEFPRWPDPQVAGVGSTQHHAAVAAVRRDYPLAGTRVGERRDPFDADQDDEILDFMTSKVRLVGVYGQPMFSPRISIVTQGGRAFSGSYEYSQLEWTFAELATKLEPLAETLTADYRQFADLVGVARDFDALESLNPVFAAVAGGCPR